MLGSCSSPERPHGLFFQDCKDKNNFLNKKSHEKSFFLFPVQVNPGLTRERYIPVLGHS
jgi:hypothetical protein